MFRDVIELRNHLAVLLQPYLGEWEDGSPRIHIVPPQPKLSPRKLANSTTQSTLECIVQRQAGGVSQSRSARQRYRGQVFECELVNDLDNTKLIQAMSALDGDDKLAFDRDHAYTPSTSLTFERCVFWVKAPIMINKTTAA